MNSPLSFARSLTGLFCRSLPGILCLAFAPAVSAATYYAGPSGGDSLSTSAAAPGSLAFAVANAPQGATVILEDGTYDGAPGGYNVANSGVTFQAQHWHKAVVRNSAESSLWGPDDKLKPTGDVVQGIVFGPSPHDGWAGGGGDGWKFLDCEFDRSGGVGFGSHALVLHCLFTDAWSNSFDVNFATGFTMRNCIVRRGNRANGDSDSIGNKEDFATDLTFDGLVAYDNNGPALWFDTRNAGWTVKNCTFFANHGGNNWYNLGVSGGIDTTHFYNFSSVPWGSGQDQEGVKIGSQVMLIAGTQANIGAKSTITHLDVVSDNKTPPTYKYTYTISPALPAVPANGDDFAVQQGSGGVAQAYGLVTEANPNGTFTRNVTYSNTDGGFFDHASGNGYHVAKKGLTITDNLFAYDGNGIFFLGDSNKGNFDRQLAAADISHNQFKFHPGKSGAFGTWGNSITGYPISYGVKFDHNTYDPDTDQPGWAVWWGDPFGKKTADGLAALQDPATFHQDQHSAVGKVAFRGTTVPTYVFPAADDTDWSDIYSPSNTYGTSKSIHQVNDDETPYITRAIAGKSVGGVVRLTVFGHTAFQGSGTYTCEVYDYSGRYLTLTLKTAADKAALDAAVPGYAVLTPAHISVTLTSTDQYGLRAAYRAK